MTRKLKKSIIFVLSAAIIAAFLSGCNSAVESTDTPTTAQQDQYYYDISFLPLDNKLTNTEYMSIGDSLIVLDESKSKIFWTDTNGSELSTQEPIDFDEQIVMSWWADSERIYIALATTRIESDVEAGRFFFYDNPILRVITYSGEVLWETDLPILEDTGHYDSLTVVGDYVYSSNFDYLVRISESGIDWLYIPDYIPRDSYENWVTLFSLLEAQDKQLYVVLQLDSYNYLYSFDFDNPRFDAPLTERSNNESLWFYPGSEHGYDIYISKAGGIYGYNYSDESLTFIFDYSECANLYSVLGANNPVCIGQDSFLLNSYGTYGSNAGDYTINITKQPGVKPESKKTIITIGGVGETNLSSGGLEINLDTVSINAEVLKFNISHEDYELVIKKYDDEAALYMDIVKGEAPDIILTKDIDWKSLAETGMLSDLYNFMDSDKSFDRDDLFGNILKGVEQGGALYYFPTSFTVSGMSGSSELLDGVSGWTLSEYLEFGETLPEGMELATPKTIYNLSSWYFETGYSSWIEAGSCHFDDGSFAELLDYMKPERNLGGYNTDLMLYRGETAVRSTEIGEVGDIPLEAVICGGEAALVGYPTPNRSDVSAQCGDGIAINSASEHLDIAWEFVKLLFSEQALQNDTTKFSIKKSYLRNTLDACVEQATDKNTSLGDDYDYDHVTVPPISQDQADYFYNLVCGIECTESDPAIAAIIKDATALFFDGKRTAEETADTIQSRVSIYLAERG